jgi:hypothetical protein
LRRRVDLWCSCFTVFPTCGGFGGPPSFPFNTANGPPTPHPQYTNGQLDAEYAKLNPPPRGYQDYWRSRQADWDMKHVAQGMTNFFRAFYYMKSADFPGNQNLQPMHAVHSAKEAAEQNARMPEYYVMRREHAGHGRRSHAGRRLHKGLHKWLTEPGATFIGRNTHVAAGPVRCRNIDVGATIPSPNRRRTTHVLGAPNRRPGTGHRGKRRLGRHPKHAGWINVEIEIGESLPRSAHRQQGTPRGGIAAWERQRKARPIRAVPAA